ncbi:unnamed protein product [Pylaiella littoralis]
MREFNARAFLALVLFISQHHVVDAWSSAPPSFSSSSAVAASTDHLSSCQGLFVRQVAKKNSAPGGIATAGASGATRTKKITARDVPTCKLDRLPARTLKRVVPLRPTTERYLAFFGQTPIDRTRKMINLMGALFAFYWAAFFATRNVYVLGPGGVNAIAWRGSCLAVFYQTILRPMLGSYNRTLELWGAGSKEARRKIKGALFTGRVTKTGFTLSSQESTQRTHFQMLVEDESGRELLFDVPQVPEYRQVRRGMRVAVVVLSRSSSFYELTGVTEAYLPELDLFVGRFPLLDKRVFWDLLHERSERDRRGGGDGTDTARRKTQRLSGGRRGERLVSSSSGSEDPTGFNGYEGEMNSNYRTGPHHRHHQQQHARARETMPGGNSQGRDEGGTVARRTRSSH